MPMREVVRSGRRENFYVTDNSFIDHFAKEMQPTDIAVYHALERFANCHTRSTWVGTARIAEVLNLSQRTVQRSLKVLEDLKLIRIVQTSTMKVYFIVPVPSRAKTAPIPLFDGIEDKELSLEDDTGVAWATSASHGPSPVTRMPPSVSRTTTGASPLRDMSDVPYKEEQDLLNNTSQQDLSNKSFEEEINQIDNAAKRILTILKLPDSHLNAAAAAIRAKRIGPRFSADEIVREIVTAANQAERRGIEKQEFFDDFLAEQCARRILKNLGLPITNSLVATVTASVKAEVTYSQLQVEKVASVIENSAIEDRRRGVAIDRFYFEGVKWRSNVRVSKAEQRKLDNLEVNARVKQRLREKLGAS